MIVGTCYFPTRGDAINYYRTYNVHLRTNRVNGGRIADWSALHRLVDQKIADGEIKIGKPPVGPKQTAWIDREDHRWFVSDN